MIRAIDNVGLAVTNMERALDFYATLGFEVESREGNGASIRAGEAALYVFQAGSDQAPPPRALDLQNNPAGLDHVSFAVDDVDTSARELQGRGVQIESGPEDQDWGERTITFLDPDGNRVWFLGPLKGG